jgi:BMFP domain-containing protein YqiC
MSARRQLLDDIAKVATAAAGLMQGAGQEGQGLVRQRLERLLDRMDLVPRDEFDAVKEMAAQARRENEDLKKRVAALESAIQSGKAVKKAVPVRQSKAKPVAAGKAKPAPATASSRRKTQKTAKK